MSSDLQSREGSYFFQSSWSLWKILNGTTICEEPVSIIADRVSSITSLSSPILNSDNSRAQVSCLVATFLPNKIPFSPPTIWAAFMPPKIAYGFSYWSVVVMLKLTIDFFITFSSLSRSIRWNLLFKFHLLADNPRIPSVPAWMPVASWIATKFMVEQVSAVRQTLS